MVLSFTCVDKIPKCGHSIESFPMELFIMLYKVALTFESLGKLRNESVSIQMKAI